MPRLETIDFFNGGQAFTDAIEKQSYRYYKTHVKAQAEMFIDYWTEEDEKGKAKWEKQKIFDVKKRFNTWLLHAKEYGKLTEHRL
jgi:hypothetical protein